MCDISPGVVKRRDLLPVRRPPPVGSGDQAPKDLIGEGMSKGDHTVEKLFVELRRAIERSPSLRRGEAFLPKYLKRGQLSKRAFSPVTGRLAKAMHMSLRKEVHNPLKPEYECGSRQRGAPHEIVARCRRKGRTYRVSVTALQWAGRRPAGVRQIGGPDGRLRHREVLGREGRDRCAAQFTIRQCDRGFALSPGRCRRRDGRHSDAVSPAPPFFLTL